jgi:peptide/nickel transport system ATP-binding protein
MEPLLAVRDLSVQYTARGQPPLAALCDVSFEIAPGEAVGILGESGCGKSTLALALMGLLPQTARISRGEILFKGKSLLGLRESAMEKIRGAEMSLIFQDPSAALHPLLRVERQVADVIAAHHNWPRARCTEAASLILSEVGLSDHGRVSSSYPHQLSGGQRQRVVIAQALACRPALLIADEPTSSLDTTVQAEILALLKRMRAEHGLALLLVSHDPAVLADMVDRILVFYAGELVEEGRALEVLHAPLHPYTQALLNCRRREAIHPIPGQPPDLQDLPEGCSFEPRCPMKMPVCITAPPDESEPEKGRRVRCFKYSG